MDTRLHPLLDRYLLGQLTEEERSELAALLEQAPEQAAFGELVQQQLAAGYAIPEQPMAATEDKIVAGVLAKIRPNVHRLPAVQRRFRGWAVAAAILLLIAGSYAWFRYQSIQPVITAKQQPQIDVAPGREGAILTLEDGRQVVLDSLGNGEVASQNGTRVVFRNGQLVYDPSQMQKGQMAFNTMSTPKGRQFSLVLPDGTKVWLNAASSIRFPVAFTGKDRQVEIKGEAYFEVAAATRPFKVKLNAETEIQVLGTHFNINSYEEEANSNTTLLEGSVRVVSNGQSALLQPGQQAVVPGKQQAGGAKINIVKNADLLKVMAWRNGVFDFQDASLTEVMRQLERWYDIEVVYEGVAPKLEFIGKMGRDLPLSDVLKGLEMNNVHFRIEAGRRVIVLP